MPRVFLCDDEPNYRSLVRVVLQDAGGYEIVGEAGDGRECIDLAPALRPDILLLDVNMPGMGGIEALPRLRELLPDTKILALTTSWRSAWETSFRSLGGDGYIEKPRDALTLPGLLAAALSANEVDPLDVAEEMFHSWWGGERERTWAIFAEDVRYTPLEDDRTLVGVATLREHFDRLSEPERDGVARAIRMVALHDVVVIEATAEIPREDYRERFPVAWTVRVHDGKVADIRTFRSWADARAAAGLTGGIEPTGQREFGLGAGWLLAAARRFLRPRPVGRLAA
jgi:CheY-like chemotaxis protein